MHKEFFKQMDHICSELIKGELWHVAAANEFRKIALRGFARWNESEAIGDLKSRMCIEKLLRDRLSYTPIISIENPSVLWTSYKDLPEILHKWVAREKDFAEYITSAIGMARDIDIAIYKELISLADEVQNEAMRIKLCGMRLELANFDGHDIGRVNVIIHDYYDQSPECQKADFNI